MKWVIRFYLAFLVNVFIGEALKGATADQRAVGSVTGHLLSIQQGASIVRAHDVKAMTDAILVWKAMIQA